MEIKKRQKAKGKRQNYNSKLKTKKIEPEVRFLDDLGRVLYDKEWLKTTPNFPVYYVYQGIKKKDGLRYDITEIPAKMLGREFPKTKGHEHYGQYQELYTVLEGRALFLAQKKENNQIEDVYIVKAKKNETVIIPSFYGHVTICSGKKKLKIANWVSEKCQNNYDLFEKMEGACYYYTKDGWIKNKNYKKIPKLRFEKPLKKLPKNLNFLKD